MATTCWDTLRGSAEIWQIHTVLIIRHSSDLLKLYFALIDLFATCKILKMKSNYRFQINIYICSGSVCVKWLHIVRHEQRADTRTCRKLSFTLGIPVWAVTCLSRAMRRRPCWCSPDSPDNGRHLTRSITHCLLSDDSRFCLTEGRRGGRLNLLLRQAWYIQDLRLFIKANADQKYKRFHISSF